MNKIQEIKFYFAGWNFHVLVLLVLSILLFVTCTFNVPSGEEERLQATVVSLGITNSSNYSLSYSSARVRLAEGKLLDITLPRGVVLKEGDEIIVKRKTLLLSGSTYKFYSASTSP